MTRPRPRRTSSTRRNDGRPYDVVVLGATGFAGRLTAEYLARSAPGDLRWAIAGRNLDKLARVRDDITAHQPAAGEIGVIGADVTDEPSMRRLAESTRVLATTVGPYVLHGDAAVAACAAAGTDY